MTTWKPTGPYRFSGQARKAKFRNKSAEVLMFTLYRELSSLIEFLHKKGSSNYMIDHVDWLLAQGETRETVALCRFCEQNTVKRFSVIWGYNSIPSMGQAYTCCDEEDCYKQLSSLGGHKGVQTYPFKFSSMNVFKVQDDQVRAGEMYRWAYGLEGRLTTEKAFDFFSK